MRCNDCEDYDLCLRCLLRNKHGHHPAHTFSLGSDRNFCLKNLIMSRCLPGRQFQHAAICDGCEKVNYSSTNPYICLLAEHMLTTSSVSSAPATSACLAPIGTTAPLASRRPTRATLDTASPLSTKLLVISLVTLRSTLASSAMARCAMTSLLRATSLVFATSVPSATTLTSVRAARPIPITSTTAPTP